MFEHTEIEPGDMEVDTPKSTQRTTDSWTQPHRDQQFTPTSNSLFQHNGALPINPRAHSSTLPVDRSLNAHHTAYNIKDLPPLSPVRPPHEELTCHQIIQVRGKQNINSGCQHDQIVEPSFPMDGETWYKLCKRISHMDRKEINHRDVLQPLPRDHCKMSHSVTDGIFVNCPQTDSTHYIASYRSDLPPTDHLEARARSTNEQSQSNNSNSSMGMVQTNINHSNSKNSYFTSSKGSDFELQIQKSLVKEKGHSNHDENA